MAKPTASRDSIPYEFDVFLCYSAGDKMVVRDIATRLRRDGLRVWFDGSNLDHGHQRSRALVLCMSSQAFGSDWMRLEPRTFLFRDPQNQERRFIPLRLDDAPIKSSLTQYLYIDWRPTHRDREYTRLLEACRNTATSSPWTRRPEVPSTPGRVIRLDEPAEVHELALRADCTHALSTVSDRGLTDRTVVRVWDLTTGHRVGELQGNLDLVEALAWNATGRHALTGCRDGTIRVWSAKDGRCLQFLAGHQGSVWHVALSADERLVLSASSDKTIKLWNVETRECLRTFEGHRSGVSFATLTRDGRQVVSASNDFTVRLWDVESGRCARVLEGHTAAATRVALSADQRLAVSTSDDSTLRLWDVETGRCLCVLHGHTGFVRSLTWPKGQLTALSGSHDGTLRYWDLEAGTCAGVLKHHVAAIKDVVWDVDGQRVVSADRNGVVCTWDVWGGQQVARTDRTSVEVTAPEQVQYTNAKVLLVGESGTGKTALSKRLAAGVWEPTSDSTIGAWATHWKLPVTSDSGVEREIWLWDFGGQADQRLIHQLYMDETALAILVFDGQREDLFETLGEWERDVTRASQPGVAKLLVAGRVDSGGLRVSRRTVEQFAAERKFLGFFETSAKHNVGCQALKDAILAGINWDEIPCRTTEVLFKRLKDEIIRLRDEGYVLMRFNELRETLKARLPSERQAFAEDQLHAVVTLLTGPGVVWRLSFGSWVLLQPERINAYGQAVIRTLQADDHQRGCVMEERVLHGDLTYESTMPRLTGDDERFVLLAMHQTLVERGLCLRQPTEKGNLLIFPSYYRRERPEQVTFPAVLVSYRFAGFLDEIYSTLVVRLHHTRPFQQNHLWHYAADFTTNTGKQLGVKLTRRAPGAGDLEVYFDPAVSVEEKIIFSKYVHEHLLQHARDVERLRHYACPHPNCGTPVGNREVAMQRLGEWLAGRTTAHASVTEPPSIICVGCEKRVPLWDDLEQSFASAEIRQRVQELQDQSKIVLDNESKERVLVGDVISTVALAGQIARELTVSDHGIDLEIEFKNNANEATGQKLYLQLKSGDSYLRTRKRDGREIFTIKNERHARYWASQAFPVLLVIRSSDGDVRWMEIRDVMRSLDQLSDQTIKSIEFTGERFDVMSIRRWRDKILARVLS